MQDAVHSSRRSRRSRRTPSLVTPRLLTRDYGALESRRRFGAEAAIMIVVAIAMVAYGAITDQLWWALLAIGPIAAAAEGNDLWVRCPLCDRHTPTRRGLALVFASHTRMRDNGDNELVCTHCDRGVALSNGRSWLD